MRKLKELWLKHGVTAFIGTLFLLTFCAGCNASTSNASTRSIPVSMGFTASSDASTTTSPGDTMGEENQTGVTPSALQLTAAWTNVEKIEFEFTEPQQEDQMEESGNN